MYHETAFSKVRSVLLSYAIDGRSADLTDKPENDDLFAAGKIPVNQKFEDIPVVCSQFSLVLSVSVI